MNKTPIIISKDSLFIKKGKILTNYETLKEGVLVGKQKHFIPNESFISLNESLTTADEKRIKDLIRQQLKFLMWNLYTKNNMLLGSL